LAPNRSVHLVKVADKIMVLASTPEQVVAIGEISDPEAAARVVRESGMPSFGDCFGSALSGTPSAPGEDPEKAPDLASEIRSGIRHLWERAQEIRGVRVGVRRDGR